jgi:hypothetical protein
MRCFSAHLCAVWQRLRVTSELNQLPRSLPLQQSFQFVPRCLQRIVGQPSTPCCVASLQ